MDTYATGNDDTYEDRDYSGNVDAYATGTEDEYDDWDEEEYEEDEETYPTSTDTTSRNYYKDTRISTTSYLGSQGKSTMGDRGNPTFFNKKPNPILPTSKEELQRVYEQNLSILLQYDMHNQDFDDTSREALRRATNALMRLQNLSFDSARQAISAARSKHRQEA